MEQLHDGYSEVDISKKATSPSNDLYSMVDKSKKKSNPGNDLNSIVVKSDAATEAIGDLYSVVNKSKKKTKTQNTQNDVYSVVDKSKKKKASDLSTNINTMEKITDSPSELYSVVDKSKKKSSSDHELHEIGGKSTNTATGELYSVIAPSNTISEDTNFVYKKDSDKSHISDLSISEGTFTSKNSFKNSKIQKQKTIIIVIALFIITAIVFLIAAACASIIFLQSPDSIGFTSTSNDSSQNLSVTDRNNDVNRDLHLICGESVDNWRKVVDLNVSVNKSCPEPWAFNTEKGCSSYRCNTSVVFPVGGEYNRVCGRVIGSSTGTPNAFRDRSRNDSRIRNKVEYDGLDLRIYSSKEHIWVYAVGTSRNNSNCPCNGTNGPTPPPYVGDNYYCDDSENNILWDQNYCSGRNVTLTSSTWFNATINSTTSDIEATICTNQPKENENLFVKLLQLYVK